MSAGRRERSHLVAFSCERRGWGEEKGVEEKRVVGLLDNVDMGPLFLREIWDSQPVWDPVLVSYC